jgi:hypothetical protein
LRRSGIDHPHGRVYVVPTGEARLLVTVGLKFRSHLSDGFSSWSGRPVLPVRGPWFLITPPLPLNLLEPLQDRTGKRFEDLKSTRIEDKTDLPSYLVIVSQPDSPRILRARSSLPDNAALFWRLSFLDE